MAKIKSNLKKESSTKLNSLLTALNEQFATNVNYIYINSLKREVPFREITVLEQKTIAKLMIANEDKQNVIYNAQVALIQKICLDESVVITDLLEFDRIKIMLELYQSNFFKENYSAKCTVCEKTTEYTADFQVVIDNLNKLTMDDIEFDDEIQTHFIHYTINFPTIKRLIDYREYLEKTNASVNIDNDYSIDMLDLFIKKLTLTNKVTNDVIDIIPDNYTYEEYTEYLNALPQSIVFNSTKLTNAIRDNIMGEFQNCMPKAICSYCGTEIDVFTGTNDFFTL